MLCSIFAPVKNTTLFRLTETTAVVLSLVYTWLYIHGERSCYIYGGIGSALFVWLCFSKKIYADSALQLLYVFLAVYGFFHITGEWTVVHWSLGSHLGMIMTGAVLSLAIGLFLRRRTDARLPWIDAPVAVFSVIATWIMVNNVHENWLYWMVLNTASAILYSRRGLWVSAGMFVIYLFLSLDGYFEWNLL